MTVAFPHVRPRPRHAVALDATVPVLGWLLVMLAAAISVTLLLVERDLRWVLAPMLVMFYLTIVYVCVLYARDRALPVFEPASLAVASGFVYGSFPLLNFIAGGLRWHSLSDFRLAAHDLGPKEVGTFGWRYAVYLGFLVVTYLIVRGRHAVRSGSAKFDRRNTARVAAIIFLGVVVIVFLASLSITYGIAYSPTYEDLFSGQVKTVTVLPHFLLQIAHNAMAIRILVEQLFIALLMLHWRSLLARVTLFALLAAVAIVNAGGARTELVILLLSTLLLYHRLVRPVKLRLLIPAAALILGGFLALGVLRDLRGEGLTAASDTPVLAASNEFQVLFANAVDLHERRKSGVLGPIPWQIYWADLTGLIPSQLLPFQKVDPSMWYMATLDAADSGIGLMFGVVAQAVLGHDWLELALRGVALGLFLGLLQRWYVRHQNRFWPTILMLFLSVWMFYTVRQSTFSFFYFVAYRFVPTVVAVEVLRQIFIVPRRVQRRVQAVS